MPDRIKRPKLSKALPRHGQVREPTIRKIRSITSPGFYTDKTLPPPRRHKGDLERIMKPRTSPQRIGLPPSGRGLGARKTKILKDTPIKKKNMAALAESRVKPPWERKWKRTGK